MSDEERQTLKDRRGETIATEIFLASMAESGALKKQEAARNAEPTKAIDDERELRRLRKQERRERETSEERRIRKAKDRL